MNNLNLGCGRQIKEGYVNIDRNKTESVDVVCDFSKGLPFKDNSFGYLFSKYVIEHIEDVVGIMREIHRIMKVDGIAHIEVPHCSWIKHYVCFDHKHFFTYRVMDCFEEGSQEQYYLNIDFRFRIKKKLSWGENYKYKLIDKTINAVINRMPDFYERFLCWIIPINKVVFEMTPIKEKN